MKIQDLGFTAEHVKALMDCTENPEGIIMNGKSFSVPINPPLTVTTEGKLDMVDMAKQRRFGVKPVTETQVSIEELHGRDVATLNTDEKAAFEFFVTQGRKYGVAISVISEAPQEELDRASSRQEYDEIVERYPSRITVTSN